MASQFLRLYRNQGQVSASSRHAPLSAIRKQIATRWPWNDESTQPCP